MYLWTYCYQELYDIPIAAKNLLRSNFTKIVGIPLMMELPKFSIYIYIFFLLTLLNTKDDMTSMTCIKTYSAHMTCIYGLDRPKVTFQRGTSSISKNNNLNGTPIKKCSMLMHSSCLTLCPVSKTHNCKY